MRVSRRVYHEQVTSSTGAQVDVGMLDLLEAIWAAGFDTSFSCQGELEYAEKAYVSFVIDTGQERENIIELMRQVVGDDEWGVYNLVARPNNPATLVTESPYEENHLLSFSIPVARPEQLIARFPARFIQQLTEVFKKNTFRESPWK